MQEGKKIVSNVFYYFLDYTTLFFFGYFFWFLMGKFLNASQFGVLYTINTLILLFAIFTTLGFSESLPKFISEFLEKKLDAEVKSILRFSLNVAFFMSLAVSVLIFIFSDYIALRFYSAEFSLPLKIFSLILISGTFNTVFKAILQGFQKFKEMFISDFFSSVFRIIVALVLIYLGFQAIGGALSFLYWFTIFVIISSYYILKIKIKKEEKFIDKNFIKFSALSLVSLLSVFFLNQSGIIILSVLSTFRSVALFGVAFIFGQLTVFIPSIIFGAIFPNISELWVSNKNALKNLLAITLKLTFITVTPFLIFFLFFPEGLIKTFLSPDLIGAAPLFPSVLIGSFLFGISSILMITLYSAYHPKLRLLILIGGSAINIILSLLLIPILDSFGAALAYFASQIFIFGFSLFLLNRILNFYISKKSLTIFPIVVFFLIILSLVKLTGNIALQALIVLIAFVVYSLFLFKFRVIGKNELFLLDYLPNINIFLKFKTIFKYLVNKFK